VSTTLRSWQGRRANSWPIDRWVAAPESGEVASESELRRVRCGPEADPESDSRVRGSSRQGDVATLHVHVVAVGLAEWSASSPTRSFTLRRIAGRGLMAHAPAVGPIAFARPFKAGGSFTSPAIFGRIRGRLPAQGLPAGGGRRVRLGRWGDKDPSL
jgi:hypothetical protein